MQNDGMNVEEVYVASSVRSEFSYIYWTKNERVSQIRI